MSVAQIRGCVVEHPSHPAGKDSIAQAEHAAEEAEQEAVAIGVTIFLWLVLLLAVLAIAGRYYYAPPV